MENLSFMNNLPSLLSSQDISEVSNVVQYDYFGKEFYPTA